MRVEKACLSCVHRLIMGYFFLAALRATLDVRLYNALLDHRVIVHRHRKKVHLYFSTSLSHRRFWVVLKLIGIESWAHTVFGGTGHLAFEIKRAIVFKMAVFSFKLLNNVRLTPLSGFKNTSSILLVVKKLGHFVLIDISYFLKLVSYVLVWSLAGRDLWWIEVALWVS